MKKNFYWLNGKPASDSALTEDWESGVAVGTVRVGHLGCYFSRGLKYFCVPFAGADRVFGRVREVTGCVGCGCVTKKAAAVVVLCTGEKETGEIPLYSEDQVQQVLSLIAERCPGIAVGVKKETA